MAHTTSAKPGIYFGWYIVAAFFFFALLTNGVRSAFGIFVIPMSEEFGWSRGSISLAAALGTLVNGATQPFLGRLYDGFGGRRVIIPGLIVIGLATVFLSLTFHILFLVFMFGFVFGPAFSAASQSNTGAMLARWFRRQRATVLGLNAGGASAGGLVLVPLAMYLLQATNWRLTWAVLGLIILVLAVPLAFVFIRDDPATMGLHPDGDVEPPESSTNGTLNRGRGPLEVDRWAQSFRSWPIWQVTMSYMACGATSFLLSVHFVPYAIERGISPITAAVAFGLMAGLSVFGAIGAGMIADRFGRKNLLALVYFMRGTAFVLLLLIPGDMALWAFAIVAGFSWWATNPLTSSLTADVYGLRALGTITGVTSVFHSAAGFTSILLAGILFDLTGSYTVPFAIAGSLLFPAALSAFTVKERKYSSRYQLAPAAGN